jgi:hypothetical protein
VTHYRKKVLVKIFTIMQVSARFGRKRSWGGSAGRLALPLGTARWDSEPYLMQLERTLKTAQ